MKTTKYLLLMALCLVGFSCISWAQSDYTISESTANEMKLSGTSTLHDWDMSTSGFTGKAQFDFKKGDDQILIALNSLSFSLPVTNLKSDKKGLDNNAYEALRTDTYKHITYALSSAEVAPKKNGGFLVKTVGDLSISGVTKEVSMDVNCVVNSDGSITCSGTEALKMTDYKVDPPSFAFGAMKTGDAITLEFTIVYTNN